MATAGARHHHGPVPNYNQRYAFVMSSPPEPREGYGTATATWGLMRELSRRGKSIGLVAPAPVALPSRLRASWFNLHLPRTLRALDSDCVIGMDGDGFRYARGRRDKPFVAYLHGVKADEIRWATGSERRQLQRRAACERRAAGAADLVIAPSDYSAARARDLYDLPPERVVTLYNGIDLDDWPQRPPPADGPPRVLCVAQLSRRKGVDTLLNAWRSVHDSVPGTSLTVIGDGPERSALDRIAADQASVNLVGVCSHQEVRRALLDCQVFCLPSRQEGFGIAILEAMATGRPVVTTDAAAIPEVVGDAGILVAPDDPDGLAGALTDALTLGDRRRALVTAGRTRAELFTWSVAAARFGELLSAL